MQEIFWSSEEGEEDEKEEEEEEEERKEAVALPQETPAKRHKAEEQGVQVHRLSTADKQGLEGTAERIAAVLAGSKQGAFGKHEAKREERVNAKVLKLRERLREVQAEDARGASDLLARARAQSVARELAETERRLQRARDLSRTVLCVDMDAFYVLCELVRRPELKGLPVAVGGSAMLSTSSYEARRFGVRSAMPGYIARRLCPELVILPPDFALYSQVAATIRGVFARFDPHFSSGSLDEASLDITAFLAANPEQDAESVARRIKADIAEQTQCTASIGIAANRSLAKICSNVNKPDGLFRLPHEEAAIVAFVQALPLRKIGGIGPVTEAVLQGGLGLSKVGDLWEQRALLARVVGSEALRYYLDVALGFPSSSSAAGEGEERDKEEGPDRKSISTERTVGAEGVATLSAALAMARALCASLAEDTAKAEVRGRTVTLVLKGVDFQRRSRARSLAAAVGTAEELWLPVRRLVEEFFPEVGPFRLMGVRLSALE